ncbi:MAG: D-alanine--D-alanine ligase [Phycisphaeraceae bacterium]|nr:D-alanine--D-alanine ligase [Phycisphaeraceae bacterium]
MRIGMTYDLRDEYLSRGMDADEAAEFDASETVDSIDGALRSLGHEVDRIGGSNALMARLLAGDRWELVFNFAESVGGFGREALVPAILESFGVPYTMSDPLVCAVTLHKATTKRVLRDAGLPTPDFDLIETADDAAACALAFPLFAKPVAEGSSKGIDGRGLCHDLESLVRVCARLLDRYRQPVLVETFLPGREVTVGVLGTGAAARSVGVEEVVMLEGAERDVYSYQNKTDWEGKVDCRLVEGPIASEAEALALQAWRAIGGRDVGRVDLRQNHLGALEVIEINPLPGLRPRYSDLCITWALQGRRYEDLIGAIVESALGRIAMTPSAAR